MTAIDVAILQASCAQLVTAAYLLHLYAARPDSLDFIAFAIGSNCATTSACPAQHTVQKAESNMLDHD